MPIVIETLDCAALRDNPLDDPSLRQIPVYLPPSYADSPDKAYPVVYMLHGFTGNSQMWLNVNSFHTLTVPERFERLIKTGVCGEMILVFVDGNNAYGGSQYLNSPAIGRYEDYIIEDLIPFIDAKFRTIATREGRGVAGKSSGGYGAVRLAMRRPDYFAAMASHAGDMYFELCYKHDFPKVVNALARFRQTENPVAAFLQDFLEADIKKHVDVVNMLAMASCYSPNLEKKPAFDLPFDIYTGELIEAIWQRWLEHDPVYMLEKIPYLEALARFKLLYFDAGIKDEYNLHLGARIMVQRLRAKGLQPQHEEFEAGHMNINYRYDVSLAQIYRALSEN